MNHFGHSGDLGDLIYGLATIKAVDGGAIHLIDWPGRTTHGMSLERFEMIRSLLEAQPYIKGVFYDGRDRTNDSSLNGFRSHCRWDRNLADAHLATHGLGPEYRMTAWLTAEPNAVAPVVFARSARYHNPNFPWIDIAAKYPQAIFIGSVNEHKAIEEKIGRTIPHHRTTDLYEAARVIAGCKLFVGNQSAPLAIAEGLKMPLICEVCPYADNCRFKRLNRMEILKMGAAIEFPAV